MEMIHGNGLIQLFTSVKGLKSYRAEQRMLKAHLKISKCVDARCKSNNHAPIDP